MEQAITTGEERHIVKRIRKGKEFNGFDHLPGSVLRPSEILAIQNVIKNNNDELTMFNCLLLMGIRYEEAKRVQKDKKCFDGNFVILENKKHEAIKTRGSQRQIRLSNMGKTEMRHFFDTEKYLPNVISYNEKLKRWAELAKISEENVSVRMLRKTWESWLNFAYPELVYMICESQGHTTVTAMKHYVKTSFSNEEIAKMRQFVEGWKPAEKGW